MSAQPSATRPIEGVQLLCYADRFGGDLTQLRRLLTGPLKAFRGVHILPFFVPFDGQDAGFDPVDHTTVDPRLGTWDDIAQLADAGLAVTADLIVNHVSADSAEFQDWLRKGSASEYDGMFLRFRDVFPDGATEADITSIYRPRGGLPFTAFRGADGSRQLLWTTFKPTQVDLNVRHPAGRAYLERVLRTLAGNGVHTLRIDAVGYAIKTPGTDSFMTGDTLAYVRELTALCHATGMEVLVEVHAHHTQQLAIAPLVDYVYDFATPALLLHSLRTGTTERLSRWNDLRPRNAITVLDTHDGIGIIDAGPTTGRPGLIDEDEMAAIFAWVDAASAGVSGRASVIPAWCSLPHQANTTFFDALGGDEDAYLLCRAIQFFLPGVPQVYYVGLLAGSNDLRAWEASGDGREVNRHHYTADEISSALDTPVVQAILGLVALRDGPSFDGDYRYLQPSECEAELVWEHGAESTRLLVDLARRRTVIDVVSTGRRQRYEGVADLADLGRQLLRR
ncbi:MAG: sucrose phosphorylase [Actinobacteria bacterium]|nr:sucrose phosphorylase [Actinomycetota bacterium]